MKRVTPNDVELFGALGGHDAWVWAIKAWRCRQTDITSCRLASRYLGRAVRAVREYRGSIKNYHINTYMGGKRFHVNFIGERVDRAAQMAWEIELSYTGEWNNQLGYISAYLRPHLMRPAEPDPIGMAVYRSKHRRRNQLRRLTAKTRKHWKRQAVIMAEEREDEHRHPSASTLQRMDDNELRREGSRVY